MERNSDGGMVSRQRTLMQRWYFFFFFARGIKFSEKMESASPLQSILINLILDLCNADDSTVC
jgi:hypothetical protein